LLLAEFAAELPAGLCAIEVVASYLVSGGCVWLVDVRGGGGLLLLELRAPNGKRRASFISC